MDRYGKSLRFGLLLVVLASLIALFVAAAYLDNGISVRTPSDRANLSGTATYFNASINGTNQNVTNLTFVFTLLSNGTNSYNFTDINESGGALGDDVSFNFTINTVTGLPDGSYNVTLYAYNVSGSALVNSTALTNVTVDNTAPIASFNGPNVSTVEPVNVSTTATFINLSALVNDFTLGVFKVNFNISNDSAGAVVGSNRFYIAGLLDGSGNQNSSWNASVNLTNLPAGELLVAVNASDTNNNTNASKTMIIRIDRAIPSMMFLNSTGVNASTGRTLNITDTTPNASFTVIDNLYKNLSCSLLFNNVSYNTSNVNNGTEVYLTANASLSQGGQAVSVNCTDGSSNRNSTQSGEVVAFNLTVDNVVPQVGFNSNVTPTEPVNVSTSATFVNLSSLVSDATLGVYAVRFNVSNNSATDPGLFYVAGLLSGTGGANAAWNASVNVTTLSEGDVRVTAFANDTNANLNSSEFIFLRVDRTVPSMMFLNSTGVNTSTGRTFNTTDTTPNASFTVKDNLYKNLSCSLLFGNVSYNTSNVNNGTEVYLTANASLSQGGNAVSVNCSDGSINRNSTQSGEVVAFNLTVDNVVPQVGFNSNVTLIEPVNVSTSATFINISSLVSDATLGVYAVRFNVSNNSATDPGLFYVAGLLSGTGGANAAWNASVNVTTLSEGDVRVTAFANDTNANLNSSEFIFLRVDRTVPSLMKINTSSFNTSDLTPNITFTFRDNVYKNASCTLFVANVSYNVTNLNNGTEVYLTVNASLSNSNAHTFSVNCSDGSGNRNSTFAAGNNATTAYINVTVDNIAPVVYFVGPNVSTNEPKNISLTTNTTVLNVTVTDATLGVYTVVFNITNSTGNSNITADLQDVNAFHWNYTLGLSTFPDGEYTVYVVTNDTVNNLNTSQRTWLRVDRTPPVPVINATRFNITDATPVITFNYTDNVYKNATCVLLIGNVSYNSSIRFVNNTKTNYTMNTTLVDGSYDVSINCTDGSGVQGASAAVNVTVNASEMFSIGMDGVTSSGGTLLVNVSNTSKVNNCTFNDGTNAASNMSRVAVGTSAFTATITGLAAATAHTLTATCWDAFGNNFTNTTPSFTTLTGTTASSSSSSSGGGSAVAKSTTTEPVAEEPVAASSGSTGTGSSGGAAGSRGADVGDADQAAGAANAAAAAEAARQALAGQAISAKLRAIFTDYSALWLVGVVVLLAVVGVVYWLRMRRD